MIVTEGNESLLNFIIFLLFIYKVYGPAPPGSAAAMRESSGYLEKDDHMVIISIFSLGCPYNISESLVDL